MVRVGADAALGSGEGDRGLAELLERSKLYRQLVTSGEPDQNYIDESVEVLS